MTVYKIDIPWVSNMLKQTYSKKLEIFEISLGPNLEILNSKKWEYKEEKWVGKPFSESFQRGAKIHDKPIFNTQSNQKGTLYFTKFEYAEISKLVLIKQMRKKYEEEIDKLKETLKRNVPDVSKRLHELQQEFPEQFI